MTALGPLGPSALVDGAALSRLFSRTQPAAATQAASKRPVKRPETQQVKLISSKRAQNVAIVLARLSLSTKVTAAAAAAAKAAAANAAAACCCCAAGMALAVPCLRWDVACCCCFCSFCCCCDAFAALELLLLLPIGSRASSGVSRQQRPVYGGAGET